MTSPATPTTALIRIVVQTCRSCRRDFTLPLPLPQQTCPACIDAERASELEAFRAGLAAAIPTHLEEKLRASGFGPAELRASLDLVPEQLKKRLPARLVRPLVVGASMAEVSGFGISGGQGIGKTMCVAAMMRARTKDLLVRLARELPEVPDGSGLVPWHARAGFLWLNWPETAAVLKGMVMRQNGAQDVEALTRRASTTSILVLDDLGRERLGKHYDEDYSFGVLDRIIDHRSRQIAPVLWTSNLTRSGLATRYGGAMTSRLLGLAPAVELPRLPDIRLQ